MNLTIPFQFRLRWQNFFVSVLPQFLGFNSYTEATPIVKAIIDFSRLALSFFIVWLIGKIFMKVLRFIFG